MKRRRKFLLNFYQLRFGYLDQDPRNLIMESLELLGQVTHCETYKLAEVVDRLLI
jgi:hypothetical protein